MPCGSFSRVKQPDVLISYTSVFRNVGRKKNPRKYRIIGQRYDEMNFGQVHPAEIAGYPAGNQDFFRL
jgi:hypothetical protein